jgi:hypothetical protein
LGITVIIKKKDLCVFLYNRKNGFFKVQFASVCCVDVDTNSVEGGLDGLLGRTVKHFLHDRSGIGVPCDEDKLGGRAAILALKLQIDDTVSGLVVRESIAKVVVSGVSGTLFVDFDNLLVFNDISVETKCLRHLEFLEGGIDFLFDSDSAL